MAKGKERDLTEQGRNTGQRMRAAAAKLMEPQFAGMAGKANAKVRTQPGDAQQVNNAAANQMNGSPSAMPTPFRKGGPVRHADGGKHGDEAEDKKLFKKMFKQEESTEAKGLAKGGRAPMNLKLKKGALHAEMGIPQGKKIPAKKLKSAANSDNETTRKRAQFAINAKKWKHADGGRIEDLAGAETGPKDKVVPGAAGAGKGVPRSKVSKYAVGGVAKIRHDEMTKDQKQTPDKPSGWEAWK